MPATTQTLSLPSLTVQAQRLIELGIPRLAGLDAADLRRLAGGADGPDADALLVLPGAPIGALAPLLQRNGKPGFVVRDMTDVEEFTPVEAIPPRPYVTRGLDRGDDLRNVSPEEAHSILAERGRTPLTLHEGIFWLLTRPEVLQPNHCVMTIGSRRRRPAGGFDARTPALWISGGTGHDGVDRRGAVKVGWCWWRNRHTWLGIGSAAAREPLT